jgi:hypothetical protein
MEQPQGYTDKDQVFTNGDELITQNGNFSPKIYHLNDTHDPVEMYGGHHINMEPVELQGQAEYTSVPTQVK